MWKCHWWAWVRMAVLEPQCLIKGTCVARGFGLGYEYAQLFYTGCALCSVGTHAGLETQFYDPASKANMTFATLEKTATISSAPSTLLNCSINKKAGGHACQLVPHP